MECKYCFRKSRCAGRQKSGVQRYYCTICRKYQQKDYLYRACVKSSNETMQSLVCESVSIRGLARVLKIAASTVLSRSNRKRFFSFIQIYNPLSCFGVKK